MHNTWLKMSDRCSWVRVDQIIGVYATDVSGVTNKARVMFYLQDSDPDAIYIYQELDTQEEAERVAIELVEYLASIPT